MRWSCTTPRGRLSPDQVEAGLVDRYYRRKKKYPDEIERIDREARKLVMQKRDSMMVTSDAQMMHASLAMQHRATAILSDVLEELAKIVMRQPLSVVVGQGKTKVP